MLSVCLINEALRHEDVWGSGNIAPPFLTSALDGVKLSASRPGGFTRRERPPVSIGCGPQSRSVRCGVGKNLSAVRFIRSGGMRTSLLCLAFLLYIQQNSGSNLGL
jgi:hypothetical protein